MNIFKLKSLQSTLNVTANNDDFVFLSLTTLFIRALVKRDHFIQIAQTVFPIIFSHKEALFNHGQTRSIFKLSNYHKHLMYKRMKGLQNISRFITRRSIDKCNKKLLLFVITLPKYMKIKWLILKLCKIWQDWKTNILATGYFKKRLTYITLGNTEFKNCSNLK